MSKKNGFNVYFWLLYYFINVYIKFCFVCLFPDRFLADPNVVTGKRWKVLGRADVSTFITRWQRTRVSIFHVFSPERARK